MMDSVGEKSDVPVESTTATSETEKPVEAKPAVSDSGADGQKVILIFFISSMLEQYNFPHKIGVSLTNYL